MANWSSPHKLGFASQFYTDPLKKPVGVGSFAPSQVSSEGISENIFVLLNKHVHCLILRYQYVNHSSINKKACLPSLSVNIQP
jgi:hypothetical protein